MHWWYIIFLSEEIFRGESLSVNDTGRLYTGKRTGRDNIFRPFCSLHRRERYDGNLWNHISSRSSQHIFSSKYHTSFFIYIFAKTVPATELQLPISYIPENYSSVYFVAFPFALSIGYFASFCSIFIFTISSASSSNLSRRFLSFYRTCIYSRL